MAERSTRGADQPTRALHIALAGNPNVGKSSLFNRLTGSQQHVANWPGKTVERHTGTFSIGDIEVACIDLPGTYSLAGNSPEERIAAEALLDSALDGVVLVLDVTNLERNLYLAAQIAELGRPMVVVCNMADAAERDGLLLDDQALSRAFAAPVVRTVARDGRGLEALRDAIASVAPRIGNAATEGTR